MLPRLQGSTRYGLHPPPTVSCILALWADPSLRSAPFRMTVGRSASFRVIFGAAGRGQYDLEGHDPVRWGRHSVYFGRRSRDLVGRGCCGRRILAASPADDCQPRRTVFSHGLPDRRRQSWLEFGRIPSGT